MNSQVDEYDLIISAIINFFLKKAGNRAMPNLFPSIFNEERLKIHINKSKYYLIKINLGNFL